jgi:hypothetical protein
MKPNDISTFFSRQKNAYGGDLDTAIVRVFNPHGIEEFFIISIDADMATVIMRNGDSGYVKSSIPLAEISRISSIKIDEFYKPKKTSEIYTASPIRFGQGGDIEVQKTHSDKIWDYISLVSEKIYSLINDEHKTGDIVSQNTDLIKSYFAKGISVEDAVGILLGQNKGNRGIVVLYVENDICHSRKEDFDVGISYNLKTLRVVSAIKSGGVYGQIFSIQTKKEISVTESQAIHFIDLIKGNLNISENPKFCLVVCNYQEPKKENGLMLLSSIKFTAKNFIRLKQSIRGIVESAKLDIGKDFTFTIKQEL